MLLLASCTDLHDGARGKPSAGTERPLPPAAAEPHSIGAASAGTEQPSREMNVAGTGRFVREPQRRREPASATVGDGGVSLSYADTDVREVLRDVLQEILHLGYVVDPKVQGTVTLNTGRPLAREALLPALEAALRTNGISLSQEGEIYRVSTLEDGAKTAQSVLPKGTARPGFGVRVFPLKFAAAAQLQQTLQPFVPAGGAVQADGARNLLIASGARQDLDNFGDIVDLFDVDWIAGMSYGIYPLKVGNIRAVASELDTIFSDNPDAPPSGLVRIIPLERLNSLLVITTQASYLNHVRTWIERLDYGNDETTPRLFHYYVQNSRASDLASVLSGLLPSGDVRTPQSQATSGGASGAASTGSLFGASNTGSTGGLGGAAGSLSGQNSTSSPFSSASTSSSSSSSFGTGAASSTTGSSGVQKSALQSGAASSRSNVVRERRGPGGGDDLDLPPVRVVADEQNNALVIFARPRDSRMVEEVIRKLDVVPLQVLIEATIAEVTLSDQLQYGLQFFLKDGASRLSLSTAGGAVPVPVFPGFNYVLAAGGAQAVLTALSSITDVNVVSAPQLLVVDHQTATLQVGDQVPVSVQQAQSLLTADAPIVNSIQFKDTGVILQVTPSVNSSGLVTLQIQQEVSDVAQTTTSSIDSPTIQQRRILSTVAVQDGKTVALGGLIRDNRTTTRSGIPFLSDIPIAGALFRTTKKSKNRTELLVMLTPRVIRNSKEARDATDELRNRLRALAPLDLPTH
jgi:general secretion pathway protein D